MTSDVPIESARAARTRSTLLRAGFELLVERPIDSITIDDIVDTASVGKGSFFRHFGDKYEFAAMITADLRGEIEQAITRANAGINDPVVRLAQGVLVPVEAAVSRSKQAKVLLRAAARTTLADHPLNRGVRTIVKDCVAEGLLREEATVSGMVFWLGVCHGTTRNIVERGLGRTAAADEIGNVLTLGLLGLGVDPKQVTRLASDGRAAIRSGALRQFLSDGPPWLR